MERNIAVEKLIEDSGLITHHKVINQLREKGWDVLVSPYYYDSIANAVKEIDVIAEKQFNSASLARNSSVQINAQLFLECKYIKQEIVFWFDDRNIDQAVKNLGGKRYLTPFSHLFPLFLKNTDMIYRSAQPPLKLRREGRFVALTKPAKRSKMFSSETKRI